MNTQQNNAQLSKKENSIDNYKIYLIDDESLMFNQEKTIVFPKTTDYIKLTKYFKQLQQNINAKEEILLISSNQDVINIAITIGIDTCFINKGINDLESYSTTFETSDINKLIDTRKNKVKTLGIK